MHLPAPLVLSVVAALVFGEAAVFLGFVLPGETAVLTCRVHDQGRIGLEPFDAYYRSIFVWVRQHETWRCVIGQTTSTARPE